jgi:hypothetical protein
LEEIKVKREGDEAAYLQTRWRRRGCFVLAAAAALKVGAEDAVLMGEEAGSKVGQQPGEPSRATPCPPVLLPMASDKGDAWRRRKSAPWSRPRPSHAYPTGRQRGRDVGGGDQRRRLGYLEGSRSDDLAAARVWRMGAALGGRKDARE